MTITDMQLKTSMQDIENWNMHENDIAYLLVLGKSHMIRSRTDHTQSITFSLIYIRNLLGES